MTNNNHLTQKKIRQTKRAERKAIGQNEKEQKNKQITQQLLAHENYQQAKTIGAYLCMPEEVNVKAIIDHAWADGKLVYLPVVIALGEPLKFALYMPETTLTKDCLDIKIPDAKNSEYISAQDLDMVVTPLVAFDENCNRIGMGGGFYDRTFAFKANSDDKSGVVAKKLPVLMGVAFETQRVNAKINSNDWDICPDLIISEKTTYYS